MRTIATLLVTLALVAVPAGVAAEHLSAGAQDTLGTELEETPDNRSVEGIEPATDETPYGVGTQPPSACYQAEGALSVDEVREAATSDGFCGKLVYEREDVTRVSPHDQHLPAPDIVAGFDVQRTWRVGEDDIGYCLPFCTPGGSLAWDAVHTAGNATGLTDGPDEAREEDPGRTHTIGVELDARSPVGLAQSETDAWRMNGWTAPAAATAFVGHLVGSDGEPIGDDELQATVDQLVADDGLSQDTSWELVCGLSPDESFVSIPETICDVRMTYVDADAGDGEPELDSYDGRCGSPAYVCGAAGGGYWRAHATGLFGVYGNDPGEHLRWHWVVAPNAQDEEVAEPRFDFDGDGATYPYLAHDLDVYTPVQSLEEAPTASTENTKAYAKALAPPLVVGP